MKSASTHKLQRCAQNNEKEGSLEIWIISFDKSDSHAPYRRFMQREFIILDCWILHEHIETTSSLKMHLPLWMDWTFYLPFIKWQTTDDKSSYAIKEHTRENTHNPVECRRCAIAHMATRIALETIDLHVKGNNEIQIEIHINTNQKIKTNFNSWVYQH